MEPLIHFVAPFVALSLLGVELKKALPISLLAILPDLDALFMVHRSFTHSLAVLVAVALPVLVALHFYRPGAQRYFSLALFSISSHLALDLFDGYTPLLWPLYDQSLWIRTDLMAHIGSPPIFSIGAQVLTRPVVFSTFQSLDAPLFTGEGLILSLVMLSPFLIRAFLSRSRAAP